MTARLRESIQTLEQRVVDRTQRLEAVADLNERLSAILDFDQLLQEMVEQVKKRFGYYHAHVYIIDNDRQNLIMTAGAGGPGRQMKAAGHHISLSAPKSLVARAARSGEIVWVDNVREDPEWLPNPLLPDTWSEMAVPVTVEGKIVGVLDVQQNAIGGLDESDAGLLRSLAGHVAVAIRNAQLFANVENALAEAQRMQAQYLEQSWLRSNIAAMKGQHAYIAPTALSPDEAAPQPQYMNQIRRQALNSDKPIIVDLDTEGNTNSKSVISPVTLRGQIIGALHLHPGNRQRDWSQQDIAMIQVVANRLAQTAENLRLFEETRENVNREKAIREITNKLRAAPNLDILLETAAREISQRLNVSHTVLEMGIDSKN
jgi:GAF domain-containing protein